MRASRPSCIPADDWREVPLDLLDFFLDQHSQSHAAALTDATEPMLTDQVLAGLSDAQLRLRPYPHLNSIAWLLWHLARCEDVMVNVLLTEGGQVLDAEDWPQRFNVARRDMGTGMDDATVTEVGSRVDLVAVHTYHLAVGRRTRAVVPTLDLRTWEEPIEPVRLLAAGAFPDRAEGERRVAGYWRGKTRRSILTTAIATHNFQHLGEAVCLKSLIVNR